MGLIGSRLLQMIVVGLFLTFATFVLMKLAPGDPVKTILNIDDVAVTQAEQEAVRQSLGLDQPLVVQYTEWFWRVVRLDLGESYITHRPVADLIESKLGATMTVTLGGLTVMLLIAVPLGILSAVYQNRWVDQLSRLFSLIGVSLPSFWLGLVLIYWFAYQWRLLPSMGNGGLMHLILPSVTLGIAMAGVYTRLLRSGLIKSLAEPYVRAARARGLGEVRVIIVHALREGVLPVVTMFGMSLGSLLGGSVVVEMLFAWPGLGKMVVDAIIQRDYPVIQGYVLCTGMLVVLINLGVDLTVRMLDPRLRWRS
ncbi:nickel ABC transporter permease [Brevibacillus dissolubilis]|uniref:nickel ABC transporter permease n=1 Tax=Brevibacillus dissolubilis TaxID=1844116 RepID=UPI003F6570FA